MFSSNNRANLCYISNVQTCSESGHGLRPLTVQFCSNLGNFLCICFERWAGIDNLSFVSSIRVDFANILIIQCPREKFGQLSGGRSGRLPKAQLHKNHAQQLVKQFGKHAIIGQQIHAITRQHATTYVNGPLVDHVRCGCGTHKCMHLKVA